MKIRKIYLTALALLVIPISSFAQRGVLFGVSEFKLTDMLQLSQTDYSLSTARSTAMGGAFTSLGADLASININPAGLGMYRSSAFAFTGIVDANSFSTDHANGKNYTGRFSLGNNGFALNVYQGTGSLTSFTFAANYNRLADFNYTTGVALPSGTGSIADVFALQASGSGASWNGIPSGWMNSGANPNPYYNNDISISEWGAVLAYKSSLIDPVNSETDNTLYEVNAIDGNAQINPILQLKSRGSLGEYSFAGGMNFNNKVYLGLTFGIQEFRLRQLYQYDEMYDQNNYGDNYLRYAQYDQTVKSAGNGVNLKVGLVFRPIDALRFGIAYHSPTWMTMYKQYDASMHTVFEAGEDGLQYTDTAGGDYPYNFNTSQKLLLGASYVFAGRAVISVDYECNWYNSIRLNSDETATNDFYTNEVKYYFRGSNNIRLGAEFKLSSDFALRAGYAYYSSPLKDNTDVFDAIVMTSKRNISLGAGWNWGKTSLDFAYINSAAKYTSYDLFAYSGQNGPSGGDITINSGEVNGNKLMSNIFMLTFGVRF